MVSHKVQTTYWTEVLNKTTNVSVNVNDPTFNWMPELAIGCSNWLFARLILSRGCRHSLKTQLSQLRSIILSSDHEMTMMKAPESTSPSFKIFPRIQVVSTAFSFVSSTQSLRLVLDRCYHLFLQYKLIELSDVGKSSRKIFFGSFVEPESSPSDGCGMVLRESVVLLSG